MPQFRCRIFEKRFVLLRKKFEQSDHHSILSVKSNDLLSESVKVKILIVRLAKSEINILETLQTQLLPTIHNIESTRSV